MLMEGERELTTGILSKGTSFRLIVRGHVGEREIETLIKKLQFDKEILADPNPIKDLEAALPRTPFDCIAAARAAAGQSSTSKLAPAFAAPGERW
jgi:hypothetical protein